VAVAYFEHDLRSTKQGWYPLNPEIRRVVIAAWHIIVSLFFMALNPVWALGSSMVS
jgi:hypothetical protein